MNWKSRAVLALAGVTLVIFGFMNDSTLSLVMAVLCLLGAVD